MYTEASPVTLPGEVQGELKGTTPCIVFGDKRSRIRSFSQIFADFCMIFACPGNYTHFGGADFRRKPQETAHFRRKPQKPADFRRNPFVPFSLSLLVPP